MNESDPTLPLKPEITNLGENFKTTYNFSVDGFSCRITVIAETAGNTTSDSTTARSVGIELVGENGTIVYCTPAGIEVRNLADEAEAAKLSEIYDSLHIQENFWEALGAGNYRAAIALLNLPS